MPGASARSTTSAGIAAPRLCEAEKGCFAGFIRCPYHAWTYALDGRLLGAPSTGDLPDFRVADYPLHRVALARWEGFLFINMAEDPEPFDAAWAPLLGRFTRFNLPRLVQARRTDYDVKANWKLLFQNYSECYHCGPVHPSLARATPPTSGENDLVEGPFTGGFMVMNAGYDSLTLTGRIGPIKAVEDPVDIFRCDILAVKAVYKFSKTPHKSLGLERFWIADDHGLAPSQV